MKKSQNALIYFLFFCLILVLFVFNCSLPEDTSNKKSSSSSSNESNDSNETDYPDLYFKDVRPIIPDAIDISSYNLNENVIKTLWFNESTNFSIYSQPIADEILNKGKNPGLGVKELHSQGITGKNINIAIIDQNLASLNHPEFNGKVVKYKDFDCNVPAGVGSMHGPAVLSLLIGTNIGTAPEANVYYAAVPSWLADAKYYADALIWIIEENNNLPVDQKIRVVSVSAAPSGPGTPFTQNTELWDIAVQNAKDAGIIVLDCTQTYGIISTCYYDINDPDNLSKCKTGSPKYPPYVDNNILFAPASLRTQAEEYNQSDYSYQYTGNGGLSWSIPYVAGVLAMGFQINSSLTNEKIIQLLFDTAYVLPNGNKIINPVNFINTIKTM